MSTFFYHVHHERNLIYSAEVVSKHIRKTTKIRSVKLFQYAYVGFVVS